jgi:hypothetical protein
VKKTVTNNEEKTEVIANLNAGNKVKFQYVERIRDFAFFPANTVYDVSEYEGTILEMRDTQENQLEYKTVMKHPEIERSRFLITVKLSDNKIKSFYDGRVINLQEVKEVPKGFLKRTLDKLRGK